VLIADDEPLARARLCELLSARGGYRVVAEAADGLQVLEAVRSLHPDVMFLDVRMPRLNGLQVVEALRSGDAPDVVFVTAYSDFAVAAFEADAVDYLLKPVARERFEATLSRIEARVGGGERRLLARALLAAQAEVTPTVQRLQVRTGRGTVFLRMNEIMWIDAQGNYSRLHTASGRHLMRETMRALEETLDPLQFVRIHRSLIVNVDHIRRVDAASNGSYRLTLEGGAELVSGPSYNERLRRLLG
jgi:two-component system LytT family response regulator